MNISHTYLRIKSKLLYMLKLERRLQHWHDERYLRLLYRIRMGKRLDLVHPKTFTAKLQWLKLNDRRSSYTEMVDKFEAKKWVTDRIGKAHVVPNLGVWHSFEEIDFEALPEHFVLKCTHDSGGLVICKDPSTFNLHAAREKIEGSLSRNYFYLGREWPYRDVKPRVLAEVYLPTWKPDNAVTDASSSRSIEVANVSRLERADRFIAVIDYKFFCFHGEPKFLLVSRNSHHPGPVTMDFLTLDWEPMGLTCSGYLSSVTLPSKPANLQSMITIACELSSGIPFVRVDLFEHLGRVLFSEMTFHPVSGMILFEPKSADLEIGQLLDLSLVGLAQ